MGRDPPLVRGRPWSPGRMDAAETFAESDATVTFADTEVRGGGIEIAPNGLAAPADLQSSALDSGYTEWGVYINPNESMSGVRATLGPNDHYVGEGTVRLRQGSTVLDSVSNASPGGTYELTADLSAGTEYAITHDEGGNSNTATVGANFPYTSKFGAFDATDGYTDGTTDADWWTFQSIQPLSPHPSGSATIEWPLPDDLAGWDIVPFQAVADGGTVEVYAVDADGNELAGPLEDPGDISAVSRSTNVRLRVDLSRPSADANPRLESIYRRYKV